MCFCFASADVRVGLCVERSELHDPGWNTDDSTVKSHV